MGYVWMGGDGFYKTAGQGGSGLDERRVRAGRGAVAAGMDRLLRRPQSHLTLSSQLRLVLQRDIVRLVGGRGIAGGREEGKREVKAGGACCPLPYLPHYPIQVWEQLKTRVRRYLTSHHIFNRRRKQSGIRHSGRICCFLTASCGFPVHLLIFVFFSRSKFAALASSSSRLLFFIFVEAC